MSTDILTYLGPTEFIVNQSTVITGKFHPEQIKSISLAAEAQYPLNVTINSNLGLWHTALSTGFNSPGNPWLQLRGIDKKNTIVNEQTINITVKSESNLEQSLRLITITDTFFNKS